MCTLGHQILWARQLSLVLGGTMLGVALVVALFMGGMAIGSIVAGRLDAHVERPIRVYAVLEALLAVWAAAVVVILPEMEGWGLGAAAWGSAALILPPTMFAGATLPVLVKATRGGVGQALGRLYAVNTAGAVLGVLLTGFALLGHLGVQGAAWALSGLGASVAAAAWWVGAQAEGEPRARRAAPVGGSHALMGVALLCGSASLAEEVLWTRSLIAHLNSSTYAFSLILAIFLSGLAGGAALASLAIRRWGAGAGWLVATQVIAAVTVLFSLDLIELAEALFSGYVGISQTTSAGAWVDSIGLVSARAALALLPPTLCLGFSLPLIATLVAQRSDQPRAAVAGRVAGYNALGCVLGSLGAQMVLLPALGVADGLRVTAAVHVGVALAVILWARRWVWALAPMAVAVGALALEPGAPFIGRLTAGGEVLLVDEGVHDTTAVVAFEEAGGSRRHIFSNGVAYAGDHPIGRRYMRLLGHLPTLAAKDPRRALVICAGTGMTAAAVLRHDGVEHLDLVDISPVVSRTMPLFAHVNDRAYADPRAALVLADGRRFLARAAPASYDVITLEPPPPRMAGVWRLYTREFYQHARRALRPGGAMAQWLPLHGLRADELAMLTATFLDVFPEGELVLIHPIEGALVATLGEGASADVVRQRGDAPRVAAQLSEIGARRPWRLPRVGGAALARMLRGTPVATDDRARIEHWATDLGQAETIGADERGRFLRRLGLQR